MYIVHVGYGGTKYKYYTLVRCPDGSGKLFDNSEELTRFLINKKWRYAT